MDDDDGNVNKISRQVDVQSVRDARLQRFQPPPSQPPPSMEGVEGAEEADISDLDALERLASRERVELRAARERRARDEDGDLLDRFEALTALAAENQVTDVDKLLVQVLQSFFLPAVEVMSWQRNEAAASGDADKAAFLDDLAERVKDEMRTANASLEKVANDERLTPLDMLLFEPKLLINTSRIVHALHDYRNIAVDERRPYLDYLFSEQGNQRFLHALDQSQTSPQCRFLNESACRGVGDPCDWFADPIGGGGGGIRRTGQCRERQTATTTTAVIREPTMQTQDLLNQLVKAQQPMFSFLNARLDNALKAVRATMLSNAASFVRQGRRAARLSQSSLIAATGKSLVRSGAAAVVPVVLGAAFSMLPLPPTVSSLGLQLGMRAAPLVGGAVLVPSLANFVYGSSGGRSSNSVAAGGGAQQQQQWLLSDSTNPYEVPLSNAETRRLHQVIDATSAVSRRAARERVVGFNSDGDSVGGGDFSTKRAR